MPFGVLWSRNVILSIKICRRQRTMRWSPNPGFLLLSCLFCETEIATYNQWYCKQKILSSMIFSRFVLICLQLYFSYKLLKYDFFEFFVKTNTQLAQFWHHRFNILYSIYILSCMKIGREQGFFWQLINWRSMVFVSFDLTLKSNLVNHLNWTSNVWNIGTIHVQYFSNTDLNVENLLNHY